MKKTLPVLIILLALSARLVPGPRTIDDSYITYRYARNILAGAGMVYNPGEPVLGTTTPLYTGLMTLGGLFSGGEDAPFPVIAMALNAFFDAATCLVLFKLGGKFKLKYTGIGAAITWAILPYSVTFAIGGLETSLYVLLLTGTAYAHFSQRRTAAAFLAALSLLTRPDALIFLGPLALDRLRTAYKGRGLSWSEVLAAAGPVLAWFIPAWLFYGSPLPHSITAKAVAYRIPDGASFIRLLQHYATPFMGNLTFGSGWIAVGLVLYPFLFLAGAQHVFRQDRSTWPWLAYPWLYLVTYAIPNPLIFRWYLTPPLAAYIFLILAGAERVLTDITARAKQPVRFAVSIFVVITAPALLVLQDWQLHPDHGLDRPAPEMAWYKLELLYEQAANLLEPEISAAPGPRILAAGDVGALGYYTSARILDTVGLNSPEAVAYYPAEKSFHANVYAVSPDLIIDKAPDYVVLLEVYGRLGLFQDPRFISNYHLVHKIETDIYESDGMLIFARNGIP